MVSGYVQNTGVEVHVQGRVHVHAHIMTVSGYVQVWRNLHKGRQAVLAALVMGDLVLARRRSFLHEGCQAVLTDVVDEDVAKDDDKDVDKVVA